MEVNNHDNMKCVITMWSKLMYDGFYNEISWFQFAGHCGGALPESPRGAELGNRTGKLDSCVIDFFINFHLNYFRIFCLMSFLFELLKNVQLPLTDTHMGLLWKDKTWPNDGFQTDTWRCWYSNGPWGKYFLLIFLCVCLLIFMYISMYMRW